MKVESEEAQDNVSNLQLQLQVRDEMVRAASETLLVKVSWLTHLLYIKHVRQILCTKTEDLLPRELNRVIVIIQFHFDTYLFVLSNDGGKRTNYNTCKFKSLKSNVFILANLIDTIEGFFSYVKEKGYFSLKATGWFCCHLRLGVSLQSQAVYVHRCVL